MKTLHARPAPRFLGLLGGALALASCGGSAPQADVPQPPAQTKVQIADPSKWPKDDRTMCVWKGKDDVEVSETAGPGALKPNVRRVYQTFGSGDTRHKTLVCREMDTNLDGIKDIVRTFNAKGEAVHEEADSNYDGKIDVWVKFVNGRLAEEDLDTNYNGHINVWKYYVDGQLARVKRDTNGDGKADVWETYLNGKLDRMGVDTDSDGHVDRWDRDVIAQRAAEEAEIAQRKAAEKPDAGSDAGAPVDAAPRKLKKGEKPPPPPKKEWKPVIE